jgi:hypothetical protein
MKKMMAAAALIALTVSLSACGTAAEQTTKQVKSGEEGISAVDIAYNGFEVTCALYNGYESGGLVCDWAGKREAKPETSPDPLKGELFHRVVQTSQGDVDCIVYDGYHSGAIDCEMPIKK